MKILDFPVTKKLFLDHDTFYFDIETTGFSPKTSQVFLIGSLFHIQNQLIIRQYFAENPTEEKDILKCFLNDTTNLTNHITYNGIHFDIGFINYKLKKYNLLPFLSIQDDRDLLMEIRPMQKLLEIPNCKLKTVEQHFGLLRKDTLPSKDIIDLYDAFVQQPQEDLLHALSLHNHDDLLYLGLFKDQWEIFLQKITWKISNNALTLSKIQLKSRQMIAHLKWKIPIEKPIMMYLDFGSIQGENQNLTLTLPIIPGQYHTGEKICISPSFPFLPVKVNDKLIWEHILALLELSTTKHILL